ncbi:hypothetical protein N7456_003771 [Penicillium angulare]|uniref:3'-5' exonuclease domain-containing protein n=1 Tax=Penicillium angulare TaxID=116970 RepID=A0A9W9FV90_9EURO|nr:hypothetical protein N7456_003771 [Penicillium angulare]
MASMSYRDLTEPKALLVDSVPCLLSMINAIFDSTIDAPLLCIDIKETRPGDHRLSSILTLYLLPTRRLYLIDLFTLEAKAFSTLDSHGRSLKSILEAKDIPKVIFDCRPDVGLLWNHYEVSLDNVIDLQIMELSAGLNFSPFVDHHLQSLALCIHQSEKITPEEQAAWRSTKRDSQSLFNDDWNCRLSSLTTSPLWQDVVKSCAGDVVLLSHLYEEYEAKLDTPREKLWKLYTLALMEERIRNSKLEGYERIKNDDLPWSRAAFDLAAWQLAPPQNAPQITESYLSSLNELLISSWLQR